MNGFSFSILSIAIILAMRLSYQQFSTFIKDNLFATGQVGYILVGPITIITACRRRRRVCSTDRKQRKRRWPWWQITCCLLSPSRSTRRDTAAVESYQWSSGAWRWSSMGLWRCHNLCWHLLQRWRWYRAVVRL